MSFHATTQRDLTRQLGTRTQLRYERLGYVTLSERQTELNEFGRRYAMHANMMHVALTLR